MDTHHIIPVAKGGNSDVTNRIHLHKACHKQVHGNNSRCLSLKLSPF
ncbi:HNH endonuclease [Microseira wollei]|nr:HNH endonuclease signature motif containing protein [Microseira wollei]